MPYFHLEQCCHPFARNRINETKNPTMYTSKISLTPANDIYTQPFTPLKKNVQTHPVEPHFREHVRTLTHVFKIQ